MRRVAVSLAVAALGLAGCKQKPIAEDRPPPPSRAPVAMDLDARPPDATTSPASPVASSAEVVDTLIAASGETLRAGATVVDAGKALQAKIARDPVETRLRDYARLLAIDFALAQELAAYPGVPATNVFKVDSYHWAVFVTNPRLSPAALSSQALLAIAATSAAASPVIDADRAVQAYAEAAAAWLPVLENLRAYYQTDGFVDDEFDRGRAAEPDFRAAVAHLTTLRGPMRAAVEAAWAAQLGENPDAPRTAVGRAWLACTSVADALLAPKVSDKAVNAAVSRCRRSIEPVRAAGLGATFGAEVHTAAVALGDWVAGGRPPIIADASAALVALTTKFTALWPTLPQVSAEHP